MNSITNKITTHTPHQTNQAHNLTESDTQPVCSICLDEFNNTGIANIKTLPCKHEFHAHCINRWLRSQMTCPVCRFDLGQHSANTTDTPPSRSTNRTAYRDPHIFHLLGVINTLGGITGIAIGNTGPMTFAMLGLGGLLTSHYVCMRSTIPESASNQNHEGTSPTNDEAVIRTATTPQSMDAIGNFNQV